MAHRQIEIDVQHMLQKEISDALYYTLEQIKPGMTAADITQIGNEEFQNNGMGDTWNLQNALFRVYVGEEESLRSIHRVPHYVDDQRKLKAGDLLTLVASPDIGIRGLEVMSCFIDANGCAWERPIFGNDPAQKKIFDAYAQIPDIVRQMPGRATASELKHRLKEHMSSTPV